MHPLLLPEAIEPDSRRFFQAWHGWRGERLLPHRADVRLTDVKRLLPRIILLELRLPDEAIFRVVGSDIRQHLGFELTGRDYLALAEPSLRAQRVALLAREMSQPCAAVMTYPLALGSGRIVDAEVVSAPLLPDQPGPTQLMALVTLPDRRRAEADVQQPYPLAKGHRFAFVDIGAGVPSAET